MKNTIAAGSIMVAGGMHLPSSIVLQDETDSNGWAAIEDARPTFEKKVQEAGWTFFFMAGEIKAITFGFDKEKAIRTALKRLIADVKSQHCNSIEITRVIGRNVSEGAVCERLRSRTASAEGPALLHPAIIRSKWRLFVS
jgi:hypothetical protein